MKYTLYLTPLLIAIFILSSCKLNLTPTPLPGWQSPVYQLLIEDSSLPLGWRVDPAESIASTDPTTNHVSRSWVNNKGSIGATQSVWRSYTINDAKTYYEKLHQSQFKPNRTLSPDTRFEEFIPPTEITYQSQVADEFYLACGVWDWAYCEMIARYRNYVVEVQTDLGTSVNSLEPNGLTYPQIETMMKAIDARFKDFLEQETNNR